MPNSNQAMSHFRIVHGPSEYRADTRSLLNHLETFAEEFFTEKTDLIITRAPGRLDVMGGIADYSGSLVLQLPIADATHVVLQQRTDRKLIIRSHSISPASESRVFTIDLAELEDSHGRTIDYSAARRLFSGASHWASYIVGAFVVLSSRTRISSSFG